MIDSSTMCPVHPSTRASFTCERCGTFGCNACKSPRKAGLCVACAEREGVGGAEGIELGPILQETSEFLTQRPNALLAFAGAYGVYGALTHPLQSSLEAVQAKGSNIDLGRLGMLLLGVLVVGFIFSTVTEVILTRYVGEQMDGEDNPLGETVQAALARLPAALGSNLLLSLALGLGFALCILPGIYLSVCLCLAVPAVVLGGKGAMESLSDSWSLTAERRGSVFLVLLVVGLGAIALNFVAGIIASILGRMGSVGSLLGHILQQAATGLGMCAILTVIVICYRRLTR